MIWQRVNRHNMRTAEGYAVARFAVVDGAVYVAWAPNVARPLYVGPQSQTARYACAKHKARGVANGD